MKLIMKYATQSDVYDLFKWRNDQETRENSIINAEEIKWEEHEEWFHDSLKTPYRRICVFWLIYDNRCSPKFDIKSQIPVGVVRLDDFIDETELSWMVNPRYRKNGIGTDMVGSIVNLCTDLNLIARIKEGNTASKKIAKSCGMKLRSTQGGICEFFKQENTNE